MLDTPLVYTITFDNNNVVQRQRQHYKHLVAGKHCNKNLQNIFNAEKRFNLQPVRYFDNINQARAYELYLIQYNRNNPLMLNLWVNSAIDRWSRYDTISLEMQKSNLSQFMTYYWTNNSEYMSECIKKGLGREDMVSKSNRIKSCAEGNKKFPRSPEYLEKKRLAHLASVSSLSEEGRKSKYSRKSYEWDGEIVSNFKLLASSLGVSTNCLRKYYKQGVRCSVDLLERIKIIPMCVIL